MVLHKTTDCTTQNYRSYYTKLQIVLQDKTTNRTTHNYKTYYIHYKLHNTKLQIILHTRQNYKSYYVQDKTTNRTTQNYKSHYKTKLQIVLHKTTQVVP